ncbi:MAG: exodeoxyribonuclease VII large subunit [Bacilli bacterium]|nr:exodeoxyribonuclease VII large subunit [Bacilli bacterium]
MNSEYISISDINRIIKYTIEANENLRDVYIKGEISNLKFHSRGHLYFSLKDESSKINAVMFNYSRALVNYTPKDGDSVLVHGRISVYESSGSYQIYVDSMQLDGIGNLYVLFEQLKKKLSEEGLFNPEHKKRIRRVPRKIGVITAPTGAAVKDIISTINKRFPMTEIYVFPTLVQGENASKNIVSMIELANTFDDIDTIILGRGGGSIEDLWPFNEEIVARAIYKSRIPIISGVGHEIDFTISDFVADLRAPTPTGAATFAVPDMDEVKRYFKSAREKCNLAILNTLNKNRELINKYKSNYILNNPVKLYEMQEQRLDILYDRLNTSLKSIMDTYYHILDKYKSNYILNNPSILYETKMEKLNVIKDNLNKAIVKNYDNSFNRFETVKLKLDLLNPKTILGKGYSIVYKDNKVVKYIKNIKESDSINIVLGSGNVDAVVKGVNE